ncbi:MAG: orotidine-5'-phosphate decarboxylase [Flavobacteriaceae bacterium TMED206]|nr:MAG: orotidine-5'-phosphate decarboxylase [Flavobacteriaceae bacterium TMED206]|tara:strand:+ start:1138 stop:1800 length:663 start_codon:yes stop_codon:yes gene_type:complete
MIIVAIDEINLKKASEILNNLDPRKCMVKIGSVSFNSIGQEIIYYAAEKGFDIFLDLKLHDIPNTVKKSIEGITLLPINMLTIHISGGRDMLKATMDAVSSKEIKIFGVTALTSLSDEDTNEIYKRSTSEQVEAMLDLAESVGIDGVVCSPHELELVNKRKSLLSITPGIRLRNLNDDQKRIMTPKEAINLGADYLVIGRPITASDDISKSLEEIYLSIQ